MSDAPWYRDGLRFACTRCGNCCGGASGTVRVSEEEIARLADHQGLADAEFRTAFTRRLRGGDVSLRERSDGTCVFYADDRGCSVYGVRPTQCRTWPFWKSVVHSPERWAEEAAHCPGMGQGPLHDVVQITERSAMDGTSGAVPHRMRARRSATEANR